MALLFALRALSLVDATSLWGDELSTARKSFQPSLAYLFAYLRTDTHPPLYYTLLWLYGQVVPNTGPALRLFSWTAYVLAGMAMGALVGALAATFPPGRRRVAIAVAVLLAFCSPLPVRFSIEAKSYALLVLWIALALWGRWSWLRDGRTLGLVTYGVTLGAAGLTHFYGLFYGLALAATDGTHWLGQGRGPRRLKAVAAVALASSPTLAWIWYSHRYLLLGGRAGGWIGPPNFALLEDTLVLYLGAMPLMKIAVLLLLLLVVRTLSRQRATPAPQPSNAAGADIWLDGSGLLAGILLVVMAVTVSFWKPLAFPRYFIVLLPCLVSATALGLASLAPGESNLGRLPGWGLALAVILVVVSWVDAFSALNPGGLLQGARETNDFRRLVQLTHTEPARFSSRPHHFQTAERLLVAQGRLPRVGAPWRGMGELDDMVKRGQAPTRLALAETSGPRSVGRRIRAALKAVQGHGYGCRRQLSEAPHVRLYLCRRPDPGSKQGSEPAADPGPGP